MANAIVEYVGGIQVVKAFSQSAGSYKRYSDAVTENAQYYVDWMAENQKFMAVMQTVIPSVLLPVLPVGLLLWSGGSLSAATFLTIVVLSLGLTGPLISAMTFVDELAVVGTNVGEISAILDAPELQRPERELPSAVWLSIWTTSLSPTRRRTVRCSMTSPWTSRRAPSPLGGSLRLRQEHHRQTDCRVLGRVRRQYHPGRGRFERHSPGAVEPADRYVSQDNYLFDRTVRETSAWAVWMPATRKWSG